jgi:hypothetical protein
MKRALAILAAGVTCVHLPALLGGSYFLDVYLTEVHPHLTAIGQSLSNGQLPFWTRDLMAGYPLASNPQIGTFYLPHLIASVFLSADRLIVFSVWLHSLLAAFGVYGLVRHGGGSRVAAVLAGLVYANAPFFVFYHQAIHGLIALAYLPLILLCTWRAVRTGSQLLWAASAVLLCFQMYAGHLQFVAYTGLATLWVAACAAAPGTQWRMIRRAIFQGVVALLLYAPQLCAAFLLWQESLRSNLSSQDVSTNLGIESFGFDDLVEVVAPRFLGGPSYLDFWYPEFLGLGVIVLIAVALARGTASAEPDTQAAENRRIFGGLLGGGLVYLVLVQLPGIGTAILSLPGLSAFRAPGRIYCYLLLAASVLCGHGADILLERLRRSERPRLPAVLATGGLLLGILLITGLSEGVEARHPTLDPETLQAWRHGDGWLLIAAAVFLLASWLPQMQRLRPGLLVIAVAGPLLWTGSQYIPVIESVESPPVARVLRASKDRVGRVLGFSAGDANYRAAVPGMGWPEADGGDPVRAGWSLVSNVGMTHGLQNFHGQTSLPLRRFVRRFFDSDIASLGYPFQKHPDYAASLLSHAGVTHAVAARTGQMSIQPRPNAVLERNGYVVYELPEPRPSARFYPLSLVRSAASENMAMRLVKREGPMPDVPLVVEGVEGFADEATQGYPQEATVLEERPGFARIKVSATQAGVLLYREAWSAGWLAMVDGEAVDVLPADGCFLGVPLSTGEHTVVLQYVPFGFFVGLPGLFLGLGFLGIAFIRHRRARALVEGANHQMSTKVS